MKKSSKLAALVLAGALMFSVTACTSAPASSGAEGGSSSAAGASSGAGEAANGALEKIKANGYITMSTNAEFEPFEFLEGTEFKGIDIEISQKIAEKLGVELKINNTSFDSLPLELEKDKCDFVAAGMTIDPKKNIDFTNPYFDASQAIIVTVDSDIKSADDLAGKRIGVQLGTTGDTYCTENIEGAQMSRMNKGMDAVADLIKGNLDAVVIDDYPANKLVEKNSDKVKVLDEALTVEQYGLAVKKGNTDLLNLLNDVLKELQDSGDLDAIVDKYIGEE